MKVIFLRSDLEREERLAEALAHGIASEGDEFEAMPPPPSIPEELDCDFVCFVGMKCQNLLRWCESIGQRFLYFDKAPRCSVPSTVKGCHHINFATQNEKVSWQAENVLWRVSVDSIQPLEYLDRSKHSPQRWHNLQVPLAPWRRPKRDGHIIVANSSEKYHEFYGLPHPTEWATEVASQIRARTSRPIWYRPKPSWAGRGATPIPGTKYFPTESLSGLLTDCHAVVTHGSYICVDALVMGVPGIILGPGVTRSISSRSLDDIEEPHMATDSERQQLLSNLAWTQYRLEEWANGAAWRHVKRHLI